MAIKLNGNDITQNKLNSSNVTLENLNGNKVWPIDIPVGPTNWEYYSQNPYDAQGEYTYSSGRLCPIQDDTLGTYQAKLMSDRPPQNYTLGYKMGIQATSTTGTCIYGVFIAV